uniref:hypothetical protein n=1 Tax=Cupriavidus yeoncheonensis TaxID=1462994 RepID=UPI003F496801
MELHMHSHQFARRAPDWRAAAVGGFFGGVVILVLGGLALWATGGSPEEALRRISAVMLGRDVLSQPAAIDAGIALSALIVHIALSIVMGLVLATIMAPFSLDSSVGMASVVGILFGVAMYWFNFHAMTHAFPWFVDARGWLALAFNIVFGLIAAEAYLRIERRGAASSKG